MGRHEALIKDELNVKAIELIARDAELVSYRIKPNLPVVGKRYGKLIPAIRVFLAIGDNLSLRDEDRALKMMNRALSLTDPEDLDTLDQVMTRIKVLRGDSRSDK